jgi:hypothetical protein
MVRHSDDAWTGGGDSESSRADGRPHPFFLLLLIIPCGLFSWWWCSKHLYTVFFGRFLLLKVSDENETCGRKSRFGGHSPTSIDHNFFRFFVHKIITTCVLIIHFYIIFTDHQNHQVFWIFIKIDRSKSIDQKREKKERTQKKRQKRENNNVLLGPCDSQV